MTVSLIGGGSCGQRGGKLKTWLTTATMIKYYYYDTVQIPVIYTNCFAKNIIITAPVD